MDKKTILAIVLSVIVMIIGMTLQMTVFAPDFDDPEYQEALAEEAAASEGGQTAPVFETVTLTATGDQSPQQPFHFTTDVFDITFDPKGASVSSIKLLQHFDNGEPVELLYNTNGKNAFLLYPGEGHDDPIDAYFDYEVTENSVKFHQEFTMEGVDAPFTIVKTFIFGDEEYLFDVHVQFFNSVDKSIPLNLDGFTYTLGIEPQVGPVMEERPDGNYVYRRFYLHRMDEKKKDKKIKLTREGTYTTDEALHWAAVCGKYFSTIVSPDDGQYRFLLEQGATEDIYQTNSIYISRPAVESSKSHDTFHVYFGPQLSKSLSAYNLADNNSFGYSGMNIDDAMESSSWLGWLEVALKWCLEMLYKVIPNYGVAIILLTFILKFATYPLTKKSTDSTAKMAALNPQIEEMKEKYGNNTDKLNREMSELYRREKINPLAGCLPMLIQFPILIAFYGLLNKHFELRGAMFIPGWIPDLSRPDTIFTLGFNLPFLGNEIHLLPILYTVSMIFSMKISQASTGGAAGSKGMNTFMTYVMPIMFFFMLYNAPSGLILYWSVMNMITIVQQFFTTRKKKKEMAEENDGNIVSIKKGKKK